MSSVPGPAYPSADDAVYVLFQSAPRFYNPEVIAGLIKRGSAVTGSYRDKLFIREAAMVAMSYLMVPEQVALVERTIHEWAPGPR